MGGVLLILAKCVAISFLSTNHLLTSSCHLSLPCFSLAFYSKKCHTNCLSVKILLLLGPINGGGNYLHQSPSTNIFKRVSVIWMTRVMLTMTIETKANLVAGGGDNDDGDEDESGGKAGVARELFASGSPTAPALLPSSPATKSLRLLQ